MSNTDNFLHSCQKSKVIKISEINEGAHQNSDTYTLLQSNSKTFQLNETFKNEETNENTVFDEADDIITDILENLELRAKNEVAANISNELLKTNLKDNVDTTKETNKYFTIDYINEKGKIRRKNVFVLNYWNCILGTKRIGYFCLLCQSENILRPDLHIETVKHMDNLSRKNERYLLEFANDFVCEVDSEEVVQYYCNPCNSKLSSIEEIRSHVQSDSHQSKLETIVAKIASLQLRK